MTEDADGSYHRGVLAHEGVDTRRMGEAHGRITHPDLETLAPIDAYVAGFRDGVHAFVRLLEAHPVRPNGLDLLVMIDRLANPTSRTVDQSVDHPFEGAEGAVVVLNAERVACEAMAEAFEDPSRFAPVDPALCRAEH